MITSTHCKEMVLSSLVISLTFVSISLEAKFGEFTIPILNRDSSYGHSEFVKLDHIRNYNVALILNLFKYFLNFIKKNIINIKYDTYTFKVNIQYVYGLYIVNIHMELVMKLNLGLHIFQMFHQKSTSTNYFFIPLSKWKKLIYI